MPKKQFINPNEVRKEGKITFTDIPLNSYKKSLKDEKKNFSKEDFLKIYRDMRIIREFESMLNDVKVIGKYQEVEYDYPGPAHLSIGQEAAAVGQAYLLDKEDFILGSHRSHGEVIAKGLSCIDKMTDEELNQIMSEYFDGEILNVIKGKQNNNDDTKEIAMDFLLYGFLAEIFARKTGFNRGLGGSMHSFFIPFGIFPNNAIVGGSAGIAMGVALYKKVNKKPGIVISNVGDASMGCGPVWEAMNMGAMDQYRTLWDEAHRGGLPIIFNFMNNQYGMGGQTSGETMAYGQVARVGAGVSPTQLHAERVDGYNPLAVIEVMQRKMDIIKNADGPVLLDTLTYRFSGHSPSDADSYRTKEEKQAWEDIDAVITFPKQLVKEGIATQEEIDAIEKDIIERMLKIYKLSIDLEASPRMDLDKDPAAIEKYMFSDTKLAKMEDREPDVLIPMEENPRVIQIAKKHRFETKDGKPVPVARKYQFRDAVFESLINKFYEDPTLVAYGEENRDWGGAFAVYRGLTEALPYHRLFNSPISEAAIVASAVGYALAGGRVCAELMYCDFLGRAGDEVFNQMAKWQSMSAGVLKMPVVLRVSVGSKYGAQHSQDWTSMVAHIPGLKVVFPVTPYDAKGLMNSALNGTDPVIFFESQRLYDVGEQFVESGVPEDNYEITIGDPDVKRAGNDVTILTIGATLYRALDAAKELEQKYGVSAEVIDARSIVPFDYEKVIESVKKTGRIILSSDASERGSYLKEIAQTVSELAFDYLDAPPVVVGAKNWITPCKELEEEFFPQASWIIDAINEKILPLKGHVSKTNMTDVEMKRCKKLGV